jgi:hypothetical protein
MIYYTSDGCNYTGMTQDTVTALRTELGQSTTFVDKITYDVYVAAHRGY